MGSSTHGDGETLALDERIKATLQVDTCSFHSPAYEEPACGELAQHVRCSIASYQNVHRQFTYLELTSEAFVCAGRPKSQETIFPPKVIIVLFLTECLTEMPEILQSQGSYTVCVGTSSQSHLLSLED